MVVLKIYGSSFSANLNFSNDKLVSFYIDYRGESEKFTINGADIVISIGNYHYTPEKKDALEKFNETIMERYKEKIAEWEINESEAKQLLIDLLDYINSVTKGKELIEKVKSAVKSENVKVRFSSSEPEFSSYTIDKEVEGLDELRTGSLIFVPTSIFFTLGFFMLFPFLFSSIAVSYPIVGVAVEVIGSFVGIIARFNVMKGFKTLDNLGKDVGIGYAGARLLFLAILFLVQGSILITKGGAVLFVIGYIIGIISNVLIGIGFYKVGDIYNEGVTKIGGILSMFIPFIGYILTYVGLGKAITKIVLPSS